MNRYTQTPLYYIYMIDESIDFGKDKLIPIFKNEIKIGRGIDCTIQYGNDRTSVSRNHCLITVDNARLNVEVLHDPGNKTFINNKEVIAKQRLKNGDVLTLSSDGPQVRINLTGDESNQRKGKPSKYELVDYLIVISILGTIFLLYKLIV